MYYGPSQQGHALDDSVGTYLACTRFRVFLLDLNLHHIARMLHHFGDVRPMAASHFPSNTFEEVDEPAIHPVLPEGTRSGTEWREVGFDHAKCAMNRPEDEKDDEEVVRVPEALKVGPAAFLYRCGDHGTECEQHDVSGPARACSEIKLEETSEAKSLLGCELSKVVPMCDGVHP